MSDMSRSPDIAMFSVRGIGVADSVSVSTCDFGACVQLLLLLHAELLLLVDDDQPEVLERDLAAQQLVGADEDVEAALAGAAKNRRAPHSTCACEPTTSMVTG